MFLSVSTTSLPAVQFPEVVREKSTIHLALAGGIGPTGEPIRQSFRSAASPSAASLDAPRQFWIPVDLLRHSRYPLIPLTRSQRMKQVSSFSRMMTSLGLFLCNVIDKRLALINTSVERGTCHDKSKMFSRASFIIAGLVWISTVFSRFYFFFFLSTKIWPFLVIIEKRENNCAYRFPPDFFSTFVGSSCWFNEADKSRSMPRWFPLAREI